ncbi:MAG: hypothetical protein WBN40_09525, partial [Pseudomonadales bacterium]
MDVYTSKDVRDPETQSLKYVVDGSRRKRARIYDTLSIHPCTLAGGVYAASRSQQVASSRPGRTTFS